MRETDKADAAGRVARLVTLTGYGLAVAGLVTWLGLGHGLIGVVLLLAGAGDIVAGRVIAGRAEAARGMRRARR